MNANLERDKMVSKMNLKGRRNFSKNDRQKPAILKTRFLENFVKPK